MKVHKRVLILWVLVFGDIFLGSRLLLASDVYGQETAQQTWLCRVEDYLRSFQSIRALFVQEHTSGEVKKGVLYLQKPGKLRLSYHEPRYEKIIVNSPVMVIQVPETGEDTRLSISDHPLNLFLYSKEPMRHLIHVDKVHEHQETVVMHVRSRKDPEQAPMILFFQKDPFQLLGWKVNDHQGGFVKVTLSNMAYNTPIEKEIFDVPQ